MPGHRPKILELPVSDISGLDNYTLPHPKNVQLDARAEGKEASPRSGSGSGGAYLGRDFRAAYLPGVTLTGSGQMVGLVETNLLDPHWVNLGSAFVATNYSSSLTDSAALVSAPQRFYRLLLGP